MLEHAFDQLGLHRMASPCSRSTSARSRRTARPGSCTRGRPEAIRRDGPHWDEVQMGILDATSGAEATRARDGRPADPACSRVPAEIGRSPEHAEHGPAAAEARALRVPGHVDAPGMRSRTPARRRGARGAFAGGALVGRRPRGDVGDLRSALAEDEAGSSAARAPRRRGSSSARSRASSTPRSRSRTWRPRPPPAGLDTVAERALAAALFNHVWTLLETPDRTPAQIDEMIHAAHASRYHWGTSAAPNIARGEWQCSRVYAASAAASLRCGTPAGVLRSSRPRASATGTSPRRTRRWRGRGRGRRPGLGAGVGGTRASRVRPHRRRRGPRAHRGGSRHHPARLTPPRPAPSAEPASRTR